MTDNRETALGVVIDPTAYPHIIDAIIENSSIVDVAQLRQTSRKFRAHVDNKLLRHVVVVTKWPSNSDWWRASFEFTAPAHMGTDTCPVLPFAPSAPEIIDVFVPSQFVSADLYDKFTNLKILRRSHQALRQRERTLFKATTAVDLLDLDILGVNDDEICFPGWTYNYAPYRIYLPPSVKRYVLHLKWDEMHDGAHFRRLSFIDSFPSKDWVLVLHPTIEEDTLSIYLEDFFPFWDIMSKAATVIETGGTFTIVGIERMCDQMDQFDGLSTAYDTLVDNILAGRLTSRWEPTVVFDAIRFVTYDEWLEELGDKKVCEGLWPEHVAAAAQA